MLNFLYCARQLSNSMKKAFFIVLILSPLLIKAQICKEIKDEFTGKTSKSSLIQLQGSLMNPTFSTVMIVSQQDTTKTLALIMNLSLVSSALKAENLSLLIKFSDNEVLRLAPNKETVINTSTAGMIQGSIISFGTDLKPDIIQKLILKKIVKLRLGFNSDLGYDIEIKDKKAKDITAAAACIS